jgi:hypothetical protein
MTVAQTVWHGTEEEQQDLAIAVMRYCECDVDSGYLCPPHTAMQHDQDWVNRLVFARRYAVEHGLIGDEPC